MSERKQQFEHKIDEKGLWVENPRIIQNRTVQPDVVLAAKNIAQSLFSIHAHCIFVAGVWANLTKFFSLNSPQQHVVIALMQWNEKILIKFVNVLASCILKSGAGLS